MCTKEKHFRQSKQGSREQIEMGGAGWVAGSCGINVNAAPKHPHSFNCCGATTTCDDLQPKIHRKPNGGGYLDIAGEEFKYSMVRHMGRQLN